MTSKAIMRIGIGLLIIVTGLCVFFSLFASAGNTSDMLPENGVEESCVKSGAPDADFGIDFGNLPGKFFSFISY